MVFLWFLILCFVVPSQNKKNTPDEELTTLGETAEREFFELLNREDWSHLQTDFLTGAEMYGLNYTSQLPGGKQNLVLKLELTHKGDPPKMFYKELHSKLEELPLWMSEVFVVSRKIRLIDARTSMVFQLLRNQGPFSVPLRAFTELRRTRLELVNGKLAFYVTYTGLDYEHRHIPSEADLPMGSKAASVFPSGFAVKRVEEDPSVTQVTWISNVDLNFSEIPFSIVSLFEQASMMHILERVIERIMNQREEQQQENLNHLTFF